MTESLLERLGATPEQIDRERDRIRSELFRRPRGSDRARPIQVDRGQVVGRLPITDRIPHRLLHRRRLGQVVAVHDADFAVPLREVRT